MRAIIKGALPFEVLIQKTLNTNDKGVIASYIKKDSVSISHRVPKKNLLSEEKTYPVSSLSRLLPHYDFYFDRGVSEKTLKDFRCGLAMSGKMYQRVIFPIFRQVLVSDPPKLLYCQKTNRYYD